jgi:hypothetical protein
MSRTLLSVFAVLTAWALPSLAIGGVPAFSAAAQSPVTSGAADWQPDPEEQWLFDLRTDRYSLGQGIRGYARGTNVCIDLADTVRALDLPVRINRELRRATGWVFDERRTLNIDREAGRVEIGSSTRPLQANDIIDTPEGWCVSVTALQSWLGVELNVDLSNSIIRLVADAPLPFELALERRQRAARVGPQSFNLADMPQSQRPYQMWQTPSIDLVATTEFGRDSDGRTQLRGRFEVFASGEAFGASFDARLASNERMIPQSLRVTAYRADPRGELLGPLHATYVGVGDMNSVMTPIGLDATIGRGAVISNRPLDRPTAFDRTNFRGDMPLGWEAELYRNGQLLAFAQANDAGRYEFLDVELVYGANQFEIVLYGPQGQVRREIRSIPVGVDAIPPGQTHYWIGAVEDGVDLIPLGDPTGDPLRRGWRAIIALERGLDPRTGVGLFATTRIFDRRRFTSVEAAVRRTIGGSLAEFSAGWQSDGGAAARLFWTGGLGNGSFQLESLWLHGGYLTDRLPAGVTGAHGLSVSIPVRIGQLLLPMQADARLRVFDDGSRRWEGAVRASATFRRLSLTSRVQWAQVDRGGFADNPAPDITVGLLASVRAGPVRLRADVRVGVSGTGRTGVTLSADWRTGDRSDWRVELGYEPDSRLGRGAISYTRRFEAFALTGQVRGSSDGAVSAGLTLSLGIGPDPAHGGIRFSRERLASQGQAMAEVFRDDNGDGLRQDDEELVPGVAITAGNAVADQPTGDRGRAMIDALPPHRPILIGIDESTLEDPLTRPALPGVVIIPRPGVITTVRLPLVATGEVEGTLITPEGVGYEGVDLELVDIRGVVRARTRTDFDGFFLFETVPYGQYRLRVAGLSAQALGISADLASVALDRARPRTRLGQLRVQATSRLAQASPVEATDATARR